MRELEFPEIESSQRLAQIGVSDEEDGLWAGEAASRPLATVEGVVKIIERALD